MQLALDVTFFFVERVRGDGIANVGGSKCCFWGEDVIQVLVSGN